jgi:hypothetical protein
MLFSRLLRLAAQRIAYSPQARTAALKAAKQVAGEAKLIARDKDKARAAGRSVRRALGKLQGERDGS